MWFYIVIGCIVIGLISADRYNKKQKEKEKEQEAELLAKKIVEEQRKNGML